MSTTKKRKNALLIRFSDFEYEKLRFYADSKQVSMSEILRDYVKSLPEIKHNE